MSHIISLISAWYCVGHIKCRPISCNFFVQKESSAIIIRWKITGILALLQGTKEGQSTFNDRFVELVLETT